MSYNLYNIKNVLSQIFKLYVSKIELKTEILNNISYYDNSNNKNDPDNDNIYYTYINNNNIIKIYYRLDINKNIFYFSIKINSNNILFYNAQTKYIYYELIKSDNLTIKKEIKYNKIVYLVKNYNDKKIFNYTNKNNINYLLLNSKIFYSKNEYIYEYLYSYKNNIRSIIYKYDLIYKKIKIYYKNYLIFKKTYNTDYLNYNICNNFLLHKLFII